jgi:hypothetical protein
MNPANMTDAPGMRPASPAIGDPPKLRLIDPKAMIEPMATSPPKTMMHQDKNSKMLK